MDNSTMQNTDRHLWPLVSEPGAPHESIHVTANGGIGINVGGHIIVQPLRAWHEAVTKHDALLARGQLSLLEFFVKNPHKVDELLKRLDELVHDYENGLPTWDHGQMAQMRELVYRWAIGS